MCTILESELGSRLAPPIKATGTSAWGLALVSWEGLALLSVASLVFDTAAVVRHERGWLPVLGDADPDRSEGIVRREGGPPAGAVTDGPVPSAGVATVVNAAPSNVYATELQLDGQPWFRIVNDEPA